MELLVGETAKHRAKAKTTGKRETLGTEVECAHPQEKGPCEHFVKKGKSNVNFMFKQHKDK